MIRIFHRAGAGRPLRVVWVLEELSEPYELIVISKDECAAPEHLARQPLGRVPVLEDEHGFVFESAAICMHLADQRPEAGLMPPLGTHDRALAYQWVIFGPAELEPPLIDSVMHRESDPQRSAQQRKRFETGIQVVADRLGEEQYMVAGAFGVADVMISSVVSFAVRAHMPDPLPQNLTDYLARMEARPARQRAVEAISLPSATG